MGGGPPRPLVRARLAAEVRGRQHARDRDAARARRDAVRAAAGAAAALGRRGRPARPGAGVPAGHGSAGTDARRDRKLVVCVRAGARLPARPRAGVDGGADAARAGIGARGAVRCGSAQLGGARVGGSARASAPARLTDGARLLDRPRACAARAAGGDWRAARRLALLLPLPLLFMVALTSRERQRRIDQALELSSAYRGTALLLGDVVEADDAYTGAHSRDVLDLVRAVCDELEVGRADAARRRVRRDAPRRRQDQHPAGDHQQARRAHPGGARDREHAHDRGTADARARRRPARGDRARSSARATSAGTAAAIPTGLPASRSRSSHGSSVAAMRSAR